MRRTRRSHAPVARRLAQAALSALLLTAGGCGWADPARLETGPALDTRAPFPELSAAEASPGPAGTAADPGAAIPDPAAEPVPDGPRTVALAGRFVADLPAASAPLWRAGAADGATLLARSSGGPPEALVYAEALSPRPAQPGDELRRFALTVDPALVAGQLTWPTPATRWADRLGGPAAQGDRLRRFAWLASVPTGGRGLGYASSAGTFTGWRWIGRNRAGALLRLARSQGEWGGQPPLDPALEAELPQLTGRYPRLAWLAGAGAVDPWSPTGSARPPVPAYLILGSAATDAAGIQIALLCTQNPACPAAADLAHLLATLRPGAPGEAAETQSLEAFAADLGIALAPRDQLLLPGQPPV